MSRPSFMCGQCRRPLERRVRTWPDGTETVTIKHAVAVIPGTPDHEPVPVPLDTNEQVSVCDFCSTPDPVWEFPVSDFEFELGVDDDGVPETFHSIQNWTACDECRRNLMEEAVAPIFDRWCSHHPDTGDWSPRRRSQMRQRHTELVASVMQHSRGDPFLMGMDIGKSGDVG